ncbi:MAG: hypothetical protein WBD71_00045 [Xanthobacteraceae bacterium]
MLAELKFNLYEAAISASAGGASASGYGALAAIAVALLRMAVETVWRTSWREKSSLRWAAHMLPTLKTVAGITQTSDMQEGHHA